MIINQSRGSNSNARDGDPTSPLFNNSYYRLTMLLFTAKINEDIGGEDGEDMITFDNNAGSDLSSSEDEDGPKIGRRRVGKECRSRWSPYH